ncbi:hypothetical protein ACLB2K_038517 [Fragaria x ananassa]
MTRPGIERIERHREGGGPDFGPTTFWPCTSATGDSEVLGWRMGPTRRRMWWRMAVHPVLSMVFCGVVVDVYALVMIVCIKLEAFVVDREPSLGRVIGYGEVGEDEDGGVAVGAEEIVAKAGIVVVAIEEVVLEGSKVGEVEEGAVAVAAAEGEGRGGGVGGGGGRSGGGELEAGEEGLEGGVAVDEGDEEVGDIFDDGAEGEDVEGEEEEEEGEEEEACRRSYGVDLRIWIRVGFRFQNGTKDTVQEL